jgi:hypothetical protein
MPRGSQWTVRENEMAIEPVFAWLGPPPWNRVPPTPQVAEWARALHEREPRHSASSWDAKIRDVLSCLPILTVKAYNGRPPGSVRRIKDGAKGPTVEGPSTRELVERRLAAMSAPRSHLDARLGERRAQVVEGWKAERIYPYTGEARTPAEAQERKIFDAVAVAAAESSAVAKEPKAARLSLRLIKEALAQPPGALYRVLKEVLELSPDQLADFDHLLDRTSLVAIIYTSKVVTDRLDFLHDLEAVLFDPGKKERLLERRELHRMLANGRTWIFGEEYTLAVDDKGLRKVLEAHLALLGRATPISEPVTDAAGHIRIVDLMLSRAAHFADHRQHLVVELKRPGLTLTQRELAQITTYAVAVSSDERFKSPDVTWDFWLLGDDMDKAVEAAAHQPERPLGLYLQGANYRIWVRRWAEVIEENRQRLHFYRSHLEYEPGEEAELQDILGKYLPAASEAGGPD